MKYKNYEEFNKAKSKCNLCEVGKAYNKVVLSDGNFINPKVVICGECPGKDEVFEGFPFVGKCGKFLRSVLSQNGFTHENSLITNLLPCRPLDNRFPIDDNIVKTCKNMWFKEEILLTNPDVILLIGAKPLKFMLGIEGITKVRGKWFYKTLNGKPIKLMACYHPSYVQRKEYMEEGKQIMEDFKNDIQTVAKEAGFIKSH